MGSCSKARATARDIGMAQFTPTDASLEGFRIGRENPAGLAVWTAVYFAATLLSAALMIKSGAAQALQTFMEVASSGTPNPEVLSAAMSAAMLPYFAAQWPLVIAQLFVQAAVLRIAFRPAARRTYLRLSVDELRVFAAFVIILILTLGATMAVSLVGRLLAGAVPALGVAIVLVGSAVVWIYISVRLLLLYPLAVDQGTLNVRTAWDLTRGRFGPILAAQILAFVFFVIVIGLGSVISNAIREIGGASAGPVTTMAALMTPGELGGMLVVALLQALGAVLLIAPSIVIYQALAKVDRRV